MGKEVKERDLRYRFAAVRCRDKLGLWVRVRLRLFASGMLSRNSTIHMTSNRDDTAASLFVNTRLLDYLEH